MKNLMKVLLAGSVATLIAACATNTTVSTTTTSPREQLLTEAGFQMKMATAPNQQKRLASLPANRVSEVRFHSRTYYVYPTATTNQFYVGNKSQYLAFKQLMRDKRAALRGTAPDQDVSSVEITAGTNPVVIREYDGWGPLLPETH